jgi:hypothetical protein
MIQRKAEDQDHIITIDRKIDTKKSIELMRIIDLTE